MPSLMDIGKSAINAQRQALNVTGQNIANVNTDGYRRRDADLKEVSGTQSELSSKSAQIGLGVSLGEVRRAFNEYLAQSTNSAESKFQSATRFVETMKRLEDAILPSEGDLSSQITAFFSKLSDIAANPGDLAPRAAAIEQASGLANAFNVTSQVVLELRDQIRQSIDEEVSAVNRLSESIALVNSRLRASNLGSAPPNALLDERDRLIKQLSEKIQVNVEYGARYEAKVTIGRFEKGPVLVDGDRAVRFQVAHDDNSGSIFRLGNGLAFKSLDAGALNGLASSLNVIESTFEKLDLLTIRMVNELNSLHTTGIDFVGERGKELFSAKQFEVNQPETNSKQLDITLLQVPGKIDAMSEMTFVYSAATDQWSALDISGSVVGKGRKEINLGGMVVKVNTPAREGDQFSVNRVRGEAGRLSFLLNDGKKFAAASNFVITPASINTGTAMLTSRMVDESPPDLESILEITTNSISPVSFTEFRSGGVVGFIPANTASVDLATFGQNPTIEFNFLPTEGVKRFSIVHDGTQYDFPSEDTRDILLPLAEDNITTIKLKSDLIAEYLNDGMIKASSGDGKTHTLKDLGLFAAGFEGGLKIAGGTNFTSGTLTTQGNATSNGVVRDGIEASGFRVFTREGRQISGQPLSPAEASLLISEENGFRNNAIYRADYLNSFGGIGYRGAEIKNLRPDGYFGTSSVTSLINNRDLTALISQDPAVNSLSAQTVTVTTSDGLINSVVNVQAGTSAKDIAAVMNATLMEDGFIAEGQTIVSLVLDSGATNSGSVTFSFELESGQSIRVTADYSDKNLAPLINKINQYIEKTGVRAEVSNDGSRVILIDTFGNDINLSNFSGSALNANILDQSYQKLLTNDVALNQATKFAGTVEVKSPRAFTLQTSLGGSEVAAENVLLSGGVARKFSAAGSVADLEWQISPDLITPQASPNGLRLAASTAEFTMKAKLNGTTQDLDLKLSSSELKGYSSSEISKVFVDRARQLGTVPSVKGSVIAALPPEGSSMSVLVGGSTYEIVLKEGRLSVSGPEDQRVLTSIETVTGGYQISIAVPGGTMSGQTIEVLNNSEAAQFGLASTDDGSETVLRGRAFEFTDTSGLAVTSGLTAGKRYIINSLGTSDFTNANAGNTLADANVGDIFDSDGDALSGTGKVKQVFVANGGTNLVGGDADFLNLLDVHSLNDLELSDVSSDWIIADNTENALLNVGDTYTLTHDGNDFLLGGQVLADGVKLMAAGKKFEVVENETLTHPYGSVITLNVNSSGVLVDESGVAISNTLGVVAYEGTSKSFDLNFGDGATVTVINSGGRYTITSDDQNLKFLSQNPAEGSVSSLMIDSSKQSPLISLVSAQTDGPISIIPSSDAKALGFQAGNFDFELIPEGFRVISTNGEAAELDLDVSGLPGQILSISNLPPEDLIVVLDKEGARRLGAQYQLENELNDELEQRDYRIEMRDKALGQVELIDTETGHSIATRYTSGATQFDLDGFRMTLSGFADQGDYFDVGFNQSKSGDSRNAEEIIALNKTTPERRSFQDDFRNIALAVGSQLVSARMVEVSSTSMRDAALATEDEMSGVNLDEEASNLMEQQQAYKAAAQILQAARQMFDTLVGIM